MQKRGGMFWLCLHPSMQETHRLYNAWREVYTRWHLHSTMSGQYTSMWRQPLGLQIRNVWEALLLCGNRLPLVTGCCIRASSFWNIFVFWVSDVHGVCLEYTHEVASKFKILWFCQIIAVQPIKWNIKGKWLYDDQQIRCHSKNENVSTLLHVCYADSMSLEVPYQDWEYPGNGDHFQVFEIWWQINCMS